MKKKERITVERESDMEKKSFIFGKETPPSWFGESCRMGVVKLQYDIEDGSLIGAIIKNPTSKIECRVGDVITKMRTGLSCSKVEKKVEKNVEKK